MKYAYYPGCSGSGTSKEYEISTRAVCRALGLEFTEIEDWSCCGSTPAHSLDPVLSAALSARNLILAAKNGADAVATPCPSCLSNLKLGRHKMSAPAFKNKVDSLLDAPSPQDPASLPDAFSVLQIITEQINREDLHRRVTRPLEGIRVACYYGCLMSRPPEVMRFDDCENPMAMDNLLTALGAEAVPFAMKTECCGSSLGIPRKDVTANLVGRILGNAKSFGADCVITACPLCHMNLDLRQRQAEHAVRQKFNIPVLYYTQILGLAFGLPAEDLLLDKLAVSPAGLLQTIADRGAARRKAEAKAPAKEANPNEGKTGQVAENPAETSEAQENQGAAS